MIELRCDFDGPLPSDWLDALAWRCRLWGWQPIAVRYDRTGRGWHTVVYAASATNVSGMEIVAAQASLGSDGKREAFNMLRARWLGTVPPFWRSRWNVLYERHSRPHRRGSGRRGNSKARE